MVKLVFTGTENSETDSTELEVFANRNNELFIGITEHYAPCIHICLNRETAIKLSKVLKSEISKLEE